ncbi:MAG: TIR domain-containing protein [Gracilibacteraceae bacterium]|jgi:WD40 repeat protein|nr:TIR domain-containing protein [Gracilibacteraceae bacterium]
MTKKLAPEYRYAAFISYRHNPRDSAVAERLIKELETFTIPSGALREKTGKKKLGRLFRDQNELPLAGDLEETLKEALRHSEWLIILCCPEFAESRYCMRELTYFIECRGIDHVIPVITEGEPVDVIPAEIMPLDAEGIAKEPLAMVVSGSGAGERLKKLRHEKLRLAARMLNVNYDDLYRRFHRRKMRLLLSAAATALTIVSLFAAGAVYAATQIEKQRTAAVANETQLLIQRSFSDSESGSNLEAAQEALAAYARYENLYPDGDAAIGEQIRQALAAAVYAQPYELIQNIHNDNRLLWDLCFSPDGKYILGVSGGGPVLIDAASGGIAAASAHASEVNAIQFSPSGAYYLAAEYWTNRVAVYETARPHQALAVHAAASPEQPLALIGAAFLADDAILLSLSGGTLNRWDFRAEKTETLAANGELTGVMLTAGVTVSPDRTLAACPLDFPAPVLSVIDLRSGERLSYPMPAQLGGRVFAFSPDGKLLAGAFAGTVVVWETESRKTLFAKNLDLGVDDVSGLLFSPDSSLLAVLSAENVKILRPRDGTPLYAFGESDEAAGAVLFGAAFSPDGKELLVYGNAMRAYSLADGELLRDFGGKMGVAAAFSPDGRYAALITNDGAAGIYSTQVSATAEPEDINNKKLYVYPAWFETANAGAVILQRSHQSAGLYPGSETLNNSPSGRYIAATYPDGYVEIWDTEKGDGLSSYLLREHYGLIRQTRLTDEYLLTAGYDGRVMMFDLGRGSVTRFISVGERIQRFELSKKGDLLIVLTESASHAPVYDLRSGKRIYDLTAAPGGKIQDIGFTPDGEYAVIVQEDGRAVSGRLYQELALLLARAEETIMD